MNGTETTPPVLEARHLEVHFPVREGLFSRKSEKVVHAVDDVTLQLNQGETLGVVGESGCGKTTLLRTLARLEQPTGGELLFEGDDVTTAGRKTLAPMRRKLQIVFQDPQSSLNPRKRLTQVLATPLGLRGVPREDIAKESAALMERVGLQPEQINRYPHEFSGGQRQRIGIARALAMEPEILLLDEPVSALDVSIQAQVVNLLEDLQDELNLSYLFVAHDLSVVRHVSDRIAVMYLGKVVELSPARELYTKPIHPYTSALLAAVPIPDPERNRARSRQVVTGEPPSPIDPPSGCRFNPRCLKATDICREIEPPLVEYPGGHLAACHHPDSVGEGEIAEAVRSDQSPLGAGDELPQVAPVQAAGGELSEAAVLIVRDADPAGDAAACSAIYAPYVERGHQTFEVVAPSAAEFAARISISREDHEWLVAEDGDGNVVGYAYAGPHNERAAYRWACNCAIYVDKDARRGGIGRALYSELFEKLRERGFLTVVAGVTLPNPASEGLHAAFGFRTVGTYRGIGFKLGRWHDVMWMQADLVPERPELPVEPNT